MVYGSAARQPGKTGRQSNRQAGQAVLAAALLVKGGILAAGGRCGMPRGPAARSGGRREHACRDSLSSISFLTRPARLDSCDQGFRLPPPPGDRFDLRRSSHTIPLDKRNARQALPSDELDLPRLTQRLQQASSEHA